MSKYVVVVFPDDTKTQAASPVSIWLLPIRSVLLRGHRFQALFQNCFA